MGLSMKKNYLYLFFILFFIISIGLASNGTKIKVDNYISLTDYLVDSEFDVNVTMEGSVTNLYGFEFNISWDPSVLILLDNTTYENNFWPAPFCQKNLNTTSVFNSFLIGCMPEAGSEDTYTGYNETLATFHFKVDKTGFTHLTLNKAELYDIDSNVISNESQSGIFINIDEPVPLTLRHEEEVITFLDDVNISVEWFDFYGLQRVTIFENSTGDWISHDLSE